LLAASLGVVGYRQQWFSSPMLSVELTAKAPGGLALAGAQVTALGQAMGETDAQGKLAFQLQADAGEEVALRAQLARPGLEFEPWSGSFVVRKWTRSDPETLRYAVEAELAPRAVAAFVQVVEGEKPLKNAQVAVAGKAVGKTDDEGKLAVPLGASMSRAAAVSVQADGFAPWKNRSTLRAGETLRIDLSGSAGAAVTLVAGYERLGRFVPVDEVEVLRGGAAIGKTDGAGRAALDAVLPGTKVELRKAGYLPAPALAPLRGVRGGSVVVPLYPQAAPNYRIVVLPVRDGSASDPSVAAALPELEDKLSDYLFSLGCFERAEEAAFTGALKSSKRSLERALDDGWAGTSAGSVDAVVRAELSLASELVLSVEVLSVNGTRLGAFAEHSRPTKLRQLAENTAQKIAELFPFEGHVMREDGGQLETTLGGRGERGLRRGQAVEVVRWSGSPPKLVSLGRAEIKSFTANGSTIVMKKKGVGVAAGDKVVLLPRARDAALSSSLRLTVLAGDGSSAAPFADVNVYRDGTWVGLTGDDGRIDVPAEAGRSHELFFVRSGVQPHHESLKAAKGAQAFTVRVPQTMAHVLIESEPSGARVIVDGNEIGKTPYDGYVPMGFRRLQIDAGEDWRAYDQVVELRELEARYTGASRIVLPKDLLRQAQDQIARGEIDAAMASLTEVPSQHPDYSSAHNLLGGLYLDEKKDADAAIREFESVLARPENRELVNKRFAVTFVNLGRAYYAKSTPEGYQRAIENLLKARDNKRFFPRERYDNALHDTLYFLALASHRLYHAQPTDALLQETARRWKDYFDFFPASLQGDPEVQQARQSAEEFYAEVRRKAGE
jgi:tetratricopeptide (TPR) repeat protein